MKPQTTEIIAVLGSGPAGLMTAWKAAQEGLRVRLFEKRKGPGRKLLVAGSSGLNITYECDPAAFVSHYAGPRDHFEGILDEFSPRAWRSFIETELGMPTFKGT